MLLNNVFLLNCTFLEILFFTFIFIVVQVHLCPFFHHHLPSSTLTPFGFVHGPLNMFLDDPSPSFPCYPPLPSPLVTVSSLFLCLWFYFCFVDYVPLIGEIIWYLSFTAWLISLSIILSSSIHTVTKGRSSLFRSAV